MRNDRVLVSYRIEGPPSQASSRAEALGLEQTVELPREGVPDARTGERVLPTIISVEHAGENASVATLGYTVESAGPSPAQLLNLLLGNSSLQPDLSLETVHLPSAFDFVLPGPRVGIAGLRDLLGKPRGALTCTALKPMGLESKEFARLCGIFVQAGVDVIKDDHGLADQAFCPFQQRVRACRDAVEAANGRWGRQAIYVPNLIGSPKQIREQLEICHEIGTGGVMLAPMLVGLPLLSELRSETTLPLLAHPALAGGRGFAPPALLGTLFRAFGADAVIFPHHGGRFAYDSRTCAGIAENLRRQDGPRMPAMPMPAGGMSVEGVRRVISFYGNDVMLLIGGSLYHSGQDLLERTLTFTRSVSETR